MANESASEPDDSVSGDEQLMILEPLLEEDSAVNTGVDSETVSVNNMHAEVYGRIGLCNKKG